MPTTDRDRDDDSLRDFGDLSPEELAAVLVPLFESLPRHSREELIPAEEWLDTLIEGDAAGGLGHARGRGPL